MKKSERRNEEVADLILCYTKNGTLNRGQKYNEAYMGAFSQQNGYTEVYA